MKKIRYRIPVKCQNGHKAFWYAQICDTHISDYQFIPGFSGVPQKQKCECPMHDLGDGWRRDGENQLFSFRLDINDKPVYEGDIILAKPSWDEKPFESIVSFSDGCFRLHDKGLLVDYNHIEVIGDNHIGKNVCYG